MTLSPYKPLDELADVPRTTAEKMEDLRRRREESLTPSGNSALDKVRAAGRMTARERLDYLLDEGSFHETGQLARHRTHDFGMYGKPPPHRWHCHRFRHHR